MTQLVLDLIEDLDQLRKLAKEMEQVVERLTVNVEALDAEPDED